MSVGGGGGGNQSSSSRPLTAAERTEIYKAGLENIGGTLNIPKTPEQTVTKTRVVPYEISPGGTNSAGEYVPPVMGQREEQYTETIPGGYDFAKYFKDLEYDKPTYTTPSAFVTAPSASTAATDAKTAFNNAGMNVASTVVPASTAATGVAGLTQQQSTPVATVTTGTASKTNAMTGTAAKADTKTGTASKADTATVKDIKDASVNDAKLTSAGPAAWANAEKAGYVDAGGYQSLANGDYNRFEQSILDPQLLALKREEMQQRQNLDEDMSKRGIYSSGLAVRAQNDLTDKLAQSYSNTLSNAAQQRYNLQAQENQGANTYNLGKAGLATNALQADAGRGTDVALANMQANNAQRQFEAQQANQMALANAAAQREIALANAAAENARRMSNMTATNAGNQFNSSNQQQMTLANMNAQNTGNQFNSANQQQMALANMNAHNTSNQFNATNQQNMTLANMNANNTGNQFNASNQQQTNLANLAAANANSQFNTAQQNTQNQFNATQQNQVGLQNAANNLAAQQSNQQAIGNILGQVYSAGNTNAANQNQYNITTAGMQNQFNTDQAAKDYASQQYALNMLTGSYDSAGQGQNTSSSGSTGSPWSFMI